MSKQILYSEGRKRGEAAAWRSLCADGHRVRCGRMPRAGGRRNVRLRVEMRDGEGADERVRWWWGCDACAKSSACAWGFAEKSSLSLAGRTDARAAGGEGVRGRERDSKEDSESTSMSL